VTFGNREMTGPNFVRHQTEKRNLKNHESTLFSGDALDVSGPPNKRFIVP